MAYLALLWKAHTIEKYRLKYEKEKINSILAANKELPKSAFYQKLTVYRNDSQKRFQRIYRNWFPEGSKVDKICTCLRENRDFALKVVIGFVGGIVLTYCWFRVFLLEFAVWTVISWIVALAITLGITFSLRVRCLVLLLIPGLFSRVGRYTLACYALVLILTGPATNTLKNLDTLSDSLACGQEQIKSSVKQITESKDNPLNLVQETMNGTIERIQLLASKMKELIVKIHRLTMSIAHVLQSSLSWLTSVEAICNTKLGTPLEHCTSVLAPGVKKCEEQFPEYALSWDWNLIVQAMCSKVTQKHADPICVVGDFAKGSIVATIKKKLNTFSDRLQTLLYVSVHIRRSHTCCSNGTLPVSQAAAGIVTDLRNRADPLLTWLSWSCTLTGLFLLLIIFRAKYYQHMFRTRSRFDNRYVTTELRELDLKRHRQGRETVLPLNTRERAKYVSTASIRLLPCERMYLTRSIIFMVITTFKLLIHMVADYSLYWVLMNIRYHESAPTNFQQDNRIASTYVSGSGPLAAIVRMLMESLSIPLVRPATSTYSCLPDPNPPDLQRYAQIGTLILLLWLLALFEPYGLRLRHVITGHYQPERAKARAVWLYYHIIRTRSCFLKYARRKLHRQYKYTSEEKLTFKRWLYKYIPWRCLRCLLRVEPEEPHCLLCYTKHRQDDLDRHLKKCDTEACPGVYCARCFMDIGQLCTICYSPEDYGDLSDVSLEKFTSDDGESDDGGDDDDKGDMKPLLDTPDHKFEADGNATHRKLTKKYNCHKLLLPKDKNNQELEPLLECDYLNKAYNQQQKPAHNFQTQSQFFTQGVEAELKANNENTSDEEFLTNRSWLTSDEILRLSTSSEKETTVKGVTIPKGKLGAVVRTMMLLTTKVNDDKYKVNNKYRPFEYLVMEMFQPLEIVKRITQMRHMKCANNQHHFKTGGLDGSFKKDIPCLYTNYILHQEKTISGIPSSVSPYLQINSQERKKYRQVRIEIRKQNRSMWSNKRNVKRYLEIKKIITDDVIKRLRKRNIHYNKHKFTRRRTRRRNGNYLYYRLISKVRKVFSKKAIENGGLDVVAKDKQANETLLIINKKQKNEQQNANNKKGVMQKSDCCIKKVTDGCSNNATAGTVDINPVSGVTNKNTKNNDKTEIDLQKKSDLKIIELEIKETTPRKLGFWKRLCLSKRERSRILTACAKDEPLPKSGFINHKKRKKILILDQKKEVTTDQCKPSKVNDEDRSYRISLYLKDREWFSKTAKYNNILDFRNETLAGLDCKTSKRLAKEIERLKKEEKKRFKREEKLQRLNERKLKKAERKAKPGEFIYIYEKNVNDDEIKQRLNERNFVQAEQKAKPAKEKITEMKKQEPADGECAYIYGKNVNDDEIKPLSRSNSSLLKKLRAISEMTLMHSKHKGSFYGEVPNYDEVKNLPFEENLIECQQSHETLSDEDDNGEACCEDAVQTNLPLNPTISISTCDHVWYVEPKRHETCQTDISVHGQLCPNHTPVECVQNMLHARNKRCFQVETKPENKGKKISSDSLKNSKKTQLTTVYKKFRKKEIIMKPRDNKEVTAYPDLESRGSQYEAVWQIDKQTQVEQSHERQHVDTQCFPAVLSPLQNSAIETEKVATRNCASQCPPVNPLKDQVIKELTESLIPPYITIEYSDEKPLKVKKTRINDVATSNQTTTTDTKTLADVSTTTEDWWSPILERKEMTRKLGVTAFQENTPAMKSREPAGGFALTVRPQCPLFLPEENGAVLSPSRYMFQSEYFNQIYCTGSPIGSSRRLQTNDELERPSKLSHKLRKGHKTKRLEECYSPRKKMHSSIQNLVPPKWRPADEQANALKYYKRRSPTKNSSQKLRKLRHDKERSRNMQVP